LAVGANSLRTNIEIPKVEPIFDLLTPFSTFVAADFSPREMAWFIRIFAQAKACGYMHN